MAEYITLFCLGIYGGWIISYKFYEHKLSEQHRLSELQKLQQQTVEENKIIIERRLQQVITGKGNNSFSYIIFNDNETTQVNNIPVQRVETTHSNISADKITKIDLGTRVNVLWRIELAD